MKILLATIHPGGLVLPVNLALVAMDNRKAVSADVYYLPSGYVMQMVCTAEELAQAHCDLVILDHGVGLKSLQLVLPAIRQQFPRATVIEYKRSGSAVSDLGLDSSNERTRVIVAGTESWEDVLRVSCR